jgi:hypothetical protein
MSRRRRDKTIRIRYYGLISVSKRGYVLGNAIALAVLGIGLLAFYAAGALPPLSTLWGQPWEPAKQTPWPWLYRYFYWFVLAVLLAELVISLRMFRRFSLLEAEQQARQARHASRPEEART